jgi:hypothetical protein
MGADFALRKGFSTLRPPACPTVIVTVEDDWDLDVVGNVASVANSLGRQRVCRHACLNEVESELPETVFDELCSGE